MRKDRGQYNKQAEKRMTLADPQRSETASSSAKEERVLLPSHVVPTRYEHRISPCEESHTSLGCADLLLVCF